MTLLPAIPLVSMALFHIPLKYLWRSSQLFSVPLSINDAHPHTLLTSMALPSVPLSIYGAPPRTP